MTSPSSTAEMALAALLDLDHQRKREAATFARETLAPAPDGERSGFSRDRWVACARAGIQGLTIPRANGGSESSIIESLLTFEGLGLGAADNGFVFALSSQVFAMQRALLSAGTDEQLDRWLPGLLEGSTIGAFAMTEQDAGSDSSAITTTATKQADGSYVLDGSKTWITLAPVADLVIVFATTDPGLGRWGITAFVIDRSLPGVTFGPPIEKMGLHSSPFGSITFDGCVVGEDARLGPEGAGAGIFTSAVEGERAFLFAGQLGATERVIDQTIERARSRHQFGAPIGSYQAVSHKIADMKLQHEMARLLVYKAAALNAEGRSVSLATAMAKLQTSEMAVRTALDAVALHGAAGYTVDLGVEQQLRDAVGGLAYSGTSDIQRMIIARLLRVDAPLTKRAATT